MTEYSHELKIPKERVAVLIGRKGQIKQEIEENTGVKLDVDSAEGDVRVSGTDPLRLFSVREIVKAVGRGFNPEVAQKLLKQDYCFEMLTITDYAKTKKDILRLKGRVIGSEGKSRRLIEETCDVSMVVYGKTIGIIGESAHVPIARKAVEMLLTGSQHSKVYKWLEKQRRDLRKLDELPASAFEIKEENDNAEDTD